MLETRAYAEYVVSGKAPQPEPILVSQFREVLAHGRARKPVGVGRWTTSGLKCNSIYLEKDSMHILNSAFYS